MLRLRKDYRKEAVSIACDEAVKRGLITSLNDMEEHAPYSKRNSKLSIFSPIRNKKATQALLNTLQRVGLMIGCIPILLTIEHYQVNNQLALAISIGTGIIWYLLLFLSINKKSKTFPRILMADAIASSAYFGLTYYSNFANNIPTLLFILAALCIPIALAYMVLRLKHQLRT